MRSCAKTLSIAPITSQRAAPLVHALSRAEKSWFFDRYYRFARRFRGASKRFLAGDPRAIDAFPKGCFLPRPPVGHIWAFAIDAMSAIDPMSRARRCMSPPEMPGEIVQTTHPRS